MMVVLARQRWLLWPPFKPFVFWEIPSHCCPQENDLCFWDTLDSRHIALSFNGIVLNGLLWLGWMRTYKELPPITNLLESTFLYWKQPLTQILVFSKCYGSKKYILYFISIPMPCFYFFLYKLLLKQSFMWDLCRDLVGICFQYSHFCNISL